MQTEYDKGYVFCQDMFLQGIDEVEGKIDTLIARVVRETEELKNKELVANLAWAKMLYSYKTADESRRLIQDKIDSLTPTTL